MHVYRVTREGRETLVTRGALDAIAVAGVDEKSGWVYFVASPENATQRYLYRAPLDGQGDPVRVTPAEFTGSNAYTISPDGRFAIHRYSRFDDPGISELVTLPEHKRVSLIDDNAALKQKVAALLKPPVEYFKVDAGDGVQVDGYMLKPADFDASKRYPVLVHIYGEPAGQTVEDRWGGTTALYHRHLASLGYLVVSFDNSGTPAPRGRAWRKAIYGAVGVLSSKQQAQALRSLAAARSYVDLDRVGRVGLERRRHQHAQPDVPVTGPLQSRDGGRAGARISASTTRSIRNATWACRPAIPRATSRRRRSTSRKGSAATC